MSMVCPHRQSSVGASTSQVKQNKGLSGGKVTGTLLTGGLSMLATGLSRKEMASKAHCSKCGSGWRF